MAGSLSEATAKFVAASTWLRDEDQPAVVTLQLLAAQVDEVGPVPALVAQYGLTHRSLLKRAPKVPEKADPLAAALAQAAGGEVVAGD